MTLGDWTGARVDSSDAGTSPPSPAEWHDVDVPGRPARFADADAVAYRTEFENPSTEDDERTVIELYGLYAHARVWLDGELLGEHDAYFVPARFEFDSADEHELVVECRAPEDRFGGVYDTNHVPAEDAVPGIWWAASVETYPETYLSDVAVEPRLDGDTGKLDVAATVDAGSAVDDAVTFSIRPKGFRGSGAMERATVTADTGERVTVERTIDVRDPAVWWPQGHGPQNYYTLRVKFDESERVVNTGFRTVTYDDDGLRVNGVRVPARGFNVLPSDQPKADVERAAEANANLVRAHAHVPSHKFHKACNEAGLLVWQDLPLTGPGEYDVDRATSLVSELLSEYDHHPSVSLFGVHDDPVPDNGNLGGGRLARARLRWRTWRSEYDPTADQTVASAFPDTHPVFPVAGKPGIGPDATHIYPGWKYGNLTDVEWLLSRYPDAGAAVGEFGVAALGANGVDNASGFESDLHAARVPDGGVDESQAHQSRVLKTVTEGLRRHDSDLLAAFALRDTDDAGMGVLEQNGEAKAGYGALQSSFEPVQAMLDEPPSTRLVRAVKVGTTVVNDTNRAVSGTLSWEAGTASGEADVTVEPFERTNAGTVRIPRDATSVELSLELPDRVVTNEYAI